MSRLSFISLIRDVTLLILSTYSAYLFIRAHNEGSYLHHIPQAICLIARLGMLIYDYILSRAFIRGDIPSVILELERRLKLQPLMCLFDIAEFVVIFVLALVDVDSNNSICLATVGLLIDASLAYSVYLIVELVAFENFLREIVFAEVMERREQPMAWGNLV